MLFTTTAPPSLGPKRSKRMPWWQILHLLPQRGASRAEASIPKASDSAVARPAAKARSRGMCQIVASAMVPCIDCRNHLFCYYLLHRHRGTLCFNTISCIGIFFYSPPFSVGVVRFQQKSGTNQNTHTHRHDR